MIVAEVGLGNVQTVIKKDISRTKPNDGHDSILVRPLDNCTHMYILKWYPLPKRPNYNPMYA